MSVGLLGRPDDLIEVCAPCELVSGAHTLRYMKGADQVLSKIRRFFAVFLCILLLFTISFGRIPAYAAVTETVLISVIIACMAAWGVMWVFEGMDKAGVTSTVASELHRYLEETGESVGAWLAYPITLVRGMFNLPFNISVRVVDFVKWLISEYGITDNSSITIDYSSADYVLMANGQPFYFSQYQPGTVPSSQGSKAYIIFDGTRLVPGLKFASGMSIYKSNSGMLWLTGGPFGSHSTSCGYYDTDNPNYDTYFVHYNNYLYSVRGSSLGGYWWLSPCDQYTMPVMLGSNILHDVVSSGIESGSIDVPDVSSSEDELYIVPDVVNPSGTLEGLSDAVLDAAVENSLTATSDLVSDGTVPDEPYIPIGPPGAYPVTGLQDVFPFCIPFDIAMAVQLFSAEAVAPAITIPIIIPSIGFRYDCVIDLSGWDDWARVLRSLELIAFVVGLAVVTRQFYIRG